MYRCRGRFVLLLRRLGPTRTAHGARCAQAKDHLQLVPDEHWKLGKASPSKLRGGHGRMTHRLTKRCGGARQSHSGERGGRGVGRAPSCRSNITIPFPFVVQRVTSRNRTRRVAKGLFPHPAAAAGLSCRDCHAFVRFHWSLLRPQNHRRCTARPIVKQ